MAAVSTSRNPQGIVLRQVLPDGALPIDTRDTHLWAAQMEWATPDKLQLLSKITTKYYIMSTPTSRANVVVTGPSYNPNDQTITEDYRYDCIAHATKAWANFHYGILGGSLWDVLNDAEIAAPVVNNEPAVEPRKSSTIIGPTRTPGDISKRVYPAGSAERLLANDIVVFWSETPGPDPRYLTAQHSFVIVRPAYDAANKIDMMNTVVNSKNGSAAPKEMSLREVARDYRYYLDSDWPVGVYRPRRLA